MRISALLVQESLNRSGLPNDLKVVEDQSPQGVDTMRMKRRTVVRILLVLVALWLLVTWLPGRVSSWSDRSYFSIACEGDAEEKRFLVEQADTELDDGLRRLTSADGFFVYRIPIGDSELERVHFCVNQVEFHLEFSPDGSHWFTLARFSQVLKRDSKKLQPQSCGFPTDGKRSASQTRLAYFRFSAADESQRSYPAVEYLMLEVSGPAPPEHFQKFSVWRLLLGFIPARLMVLIGLVAVVLCKWWWKTSWPVFGAGALLWTVSVAAKVGFAFMANEPVTHLLREALPSLPANLGLAAYSGLMTGVFECGVFLLFSRVIRRKQWSWSSAASLGVGFGAIEAVVLGAIAAAGTSLLSGMTTAIDVSSFIGSVERLIALAIHAASAVMIIYALTQRKWGWFVAAFFYKSAVDAVAGFALLSGLWKTRPWFVELALIGPFGYAGLLILLVLWRGWNVSGKRQTDEDPVS